MKVLGQAIFHYLEVFFIERCKCIEVYGNGTLEKFHYERFSLLGEFIIGGSTVFNFCCHTKPIFISNQKKQALKCYIKNETITTGT